MKLKVAIRNLYISQAVILIFLVAAYYFWFPHSFTELGGFYDTAWMLILVDLILGPLLVLLVYKENKKHLKFDINLLLGIQLIAFVFGAYSLFLKHPAYAVFTVDRFTLTNVSNIYPQPSWPNQLRQHFFSSPKFVVANLPVDSNMQKLLTLNVVINGLPDIDSRPQYFTQFDQHIASVMERSIQIEHLTLDAEAEEKLKIFTEKHKDKFDDFAFFPLSGNNKKDVIWVFDRNTAKPIEILDIDPWKFKTASKLSKN